MTFVFINLAIFFREAMIPSFITHEQAEKILATGKSIDFLREVCKEDPPRISPIIKKLFDESNGK